MSDYTYSLPFSNERFMKGIIMMLKKENNVNSKAYKIMGELLPKDIRTKGYQMAEHF